jgi:hypothetical protein
MPKQQRFEALCQKVSSVLTGAKVSAEDVLSTLPETRERLYKRRYGATGSTPYQKRQP